MGKDLILHNDWHVVARVEDLQPGKVLKARLLGEDLVLWRNDNQALAWQDYCPHRGSSLALGWIEEDTLVCPYHGLTYNHEGKCVKIPTRPHMSPPSWACVRTYHTQERYGLVWVCLGEPKNEISPFPEWDDPTYRRFSARPYKYHSSAPRVMENFTDLAHLPFVHKGYLGDPKNPIVDDYEVKLCSEGMFFGEEIRLWQPNPEGNEGTYSVHAYRLSRPLTAYFRRGSELQRLVMLNPITPVDEEHSIAWIVAVMNYNHEVPEANMQAYMDTVLGQDVSIVEAQRPRRLPLDLQTEFHLPQDQASIFYRKWLKQLGITYGTIHSETLEVSSPTGRNQ